jgi:hypothetical protein
MGAPDPVEDGRRVGVAEVEAGLDDGRAQAGQLRLEGLPQGGGEARRPGGHDVDREGRSGQPGLGLLLVERGDGLVDLAGRALPHPAAVMQHAINGRLAEAGLAGDLPNPVGVLHAYRMRGF